MRELLKIYDVSEEAIKIYSEGLCKYPFTSSEMHKIIPNSSNEDIKRIINELIDKKLLILVKSRFSDVLPHYFFIPPFAAMINAFSDIKDVTQDKQTDIKRSSSNIEQFQDTILQDIEEISQDLIEIISIQADNSHTTEILSEVEKNVKKFSQVLLTEISQLVTKLKSKSIVNEIDIERIIREINQKIGESEEIISNMFIQFKDIINEMSSTNTPSIVESFKTFIRNLGESIDKRSTEIFQDSGSSPIKQVQIVEKSLFNILTDYLSKNERSLDRLFPLYSLEKIHELISILLKRCKESLFIVIPNLEDFIPLNEFDLEYSDDADSEPSSEEISKTLKKPVVSPNKKPSISIKCKKELEEAMNSTAKRVGDLKGYELSHEVADILAKVSELNPESLIIESIQGWLNRLLVIRKHLDQNTQYLILEDIEKWKKDYLRIKKKEEPEEKIEKSLEEKSDNNETLKSEASFNGLKINIVSSEFHDNKHVRALKNKSVDYLRFNNKSIITILGDNEYLGYAICQKTKNKSKYEITGFTTSFKPLVELLQPNILKIVEEAKPTREIQINYGFNQIIENINDYSGKKISNKLKNLLDVAFEKDGISLNILEFKLLISKLEKHLYPLEDDMKTYVIEELNKLNREFSTLELVYPPEFRAPIIDDEKPEELDHDLKLDEKEIKTIDPERVNNLFDLFFEKIDVLKGVELGDQIDKFIEVIFSLQGYSQILEWRKNLAKLNTTLDKPTKEKLILDFITWKQGILRPNNAMEENDSIKPINSIPQIDYIAESEEEYISPGLSQSQFQSDELINPESFDNEKKIDPSQKMVELFEDIEEQFTELSGVEISKRIQNIVDIILETEGYSMELKSIKDWISKLKKIRNPLEEDIKEDFVVAFFNWKEKYSKGASEIQSLSFGLLNDENEGSLQVGEGNLSEKIDFLIQTIDASTGSELSRGLQDISDIVLPSYGAVAANALRQWISKLRSIRDLLEDELKQELLDELEKWKIKFT